MGKIESNREFLKNQDVKSDVRALSDMANGITQPPIQKPHNARAPLFNLYEINEENAPEKSFYASTFERCSRRKYRDKALSKYEISYLLWCTQGIKKIIPGFKRYIKDGSGRNYLRPAPSVTNPFETYVCILNSTDFQKGLYRYLPLTHQLTLVKDFEQIDEVLLSIFSTPSQKQSYTTSAGAIVFWSCLPYRGEWRSGEHIHKIMLLDLGHIAQNFYLATESIGCGCCEIGGYHQKNADDFLEIDGDNEFTVLCASIGHINMDEKDVYKNLPDLKEKGQ
ncbi:MAG: SagB/ThcOx family dehydrogenase [Spirochaetales bacterium]|nr:SagB/ThcOx family dehydrogenase [Spirochaetales bacterium]